MFTLIVPTAELKSHYEQGDYSILAEYYTFEKMVQIVLSPEYQGRAFELLQEESVFEGTDDQWFERANIIVVCAEIFAEDVHRAILDTLIHFPLRYYYGFVRFVHAGFLVGVSDHPEPALPFDTASALHPSNDHLFEVPQFRRGKSELSAFADLAQDINIGRDEIGRGLLRPIIYDEEGFAQAYPDEQLATGTDDAFGSLSY